MKQQLIDLGLDDAYHDLFSTEAERQEAKKPKVEELPLERLTSFPGHPFQVREDEELDRMTESISAGGVLSPILVRPVEDGGYQVVSGHRRLAACHRLGLETIPAIVRPMTEDEAIVAMVDANLQREHILPSEKAFAYKMKLEALSHQGITCGQVGHKSRDGISDSESGRQIQRYIRLTYLVTELLKLVDEGKMAFNPAVEVSYLTEAQQHDLLDAMKLNDCTPSHAQAIRLKKAAQEGTLDKTVFQAVLAEEKPNQREQIKLRRDDFKGYFPPQYTDEQIKRDIRKGLDLLKRQRERDREAR